MVVFHLLGSWQVQREIIEGFPLGDLLPTPLAQNGMDHLQLKVLTDSTHKFWPLPMLLGRYHLVWGGDWLLVLLRGS